MANKATIIGAGIIGLSTAYYLQKSGWEMTVADRTDLSDNCSHGNLGMIVPSHFVPLAAPGIVSQGVKWLFNSKSPFYIRPQASAGLISWGWKFLKSASEKNVERAAIPLAEINLYSKQLYSSLSAEDGFNFGLTNRGILMYYKTQKVAREEAHLAQKAAALGVEADILDAGQVGRLEPDVPMNILGAVHYRSDAHLDPNKLIAQLTAYLRNSGVKFLANTEVKKIERREGRITRMVPDKGELTADLFVLAAGSWIGKLARLAGFALPLMPGKGYSLTYDHPETTLNIPAILCEARVAITPMGNRMRYGGTMEIGPINNKININRVKGIIESVARYFPATRLALPAQKSIWFGFRPCTPDGLPYIGRIDQLSNLIVAGGHAMSGLSLGPATGKIVADLANEKSPAVDITAFKPQRF